MANKPDKLVIDTNLFIHFLISNSFHKFDKKFKSHEITLLFSEELLSEFIQVVSRTKFKKYFTDKEIVQLLDSIHEYADFIHVTSNISICRDKRDNFLLGLCLDGKADYLITGDEDLLVLKKFKKTTILKLSDYLGA